MSINQHEVQQVADVFNSGGNTDECARALSQALMPMNPKDYGAFLEAVSLANRPGVPSANAYLSLDGTTVNGTFMLKPEIEPKPNDPHCRYVFAMPGQDILQIAKEEIEGPGGSEPSNKQIQGAAAEIVTANKLDIYGHVQNGQALLLPHLTW